MTDITDKHDTNCTWIFGDCKTEDMSEAYKIIKKYRDETKPYYVCKELASEKGEHIHYLFCTKKIVKADSVSTFARRTKSSETGTLAFGNVKDIGKTIRYMCKGYIKGEQEPIFLIKPSSFDPLVYYKEMKKAVEKKEKKLPFTELVVEKVMMMSEDIRKSNNRKRTVLLIILGMYKKHIKGFDKFIVKRILNICMLLLEDSFEEDGYQNEMIDSILGIIYREMPNHLTNKKRLVIHIINL